MKLLILSLVALASLASAYPAGDHTHGVRQRVDDVDDVLEDAIERFLDPKGVLGVDVDIVDHDEDIPDADDIFELDFDDDAKDRYKVHLLPVGTATGVEFLPIEKSETGRKFRIRRPPPPAPGIDVRSWPAFGATRPKFDIVGIDPGYSARSAAGVQPDAPVFIDDDIHEIREEIADDIADAHEDIAEARANPAKAAAEAVEDAAEDAADAREDAIEAVVEGKSPAEIHADAVEDHHDAVEDKIEADIKASVVASVLAQGAPVGGRAPPARGAPPSGGKSVGGGGDAAAAAPAGAGAGGVDAVIAKAIADEAKLELSEDIAESNRDLHEAKVELAADLANPLKSDVQAHREYASEVIEAKVDLDEDVAEFQAKTRNLPAKV